MRATKKQRRGSPAGDDPCAFTNNDETAGRTQAVNSTNCSLLLVTAEYSRSLDWHTSVSRWDRWACAHLKANTEATRFHQIQIGQTEI